MKIRMTCYAILMPLLMLFGQRLYAGILNVTEVHSASGMYTVTFNNAIEIRGIVLVSSNGVSSAVLPEGVKALNTQTETTVTEALTRGIITPTSSSQITYRTGEIQSGANAKTKSTVIFNDALEVTVTIIGSENNYRLHWPRGVKVKNYLVQKMIGKTILGKHKTKFKGK